MYGGGGEGRTHDRTGVLSKASLFGLACRATGDLQQTTWLSGGSRGVYLVLSFAGAEQADAGRQGWAGGQDAEATHRPHVLQGAVLLQRTTQRVSHLSSVVI